MFQTTNQNECMIFSRNEMQQTFDDQSSFPIQRCWRFIWEANEALFPTTNTRLLVVVSHYIPLQPPCYGGWLRNPAPVDRCFIPWCIGFQHVSTMQGGAWFLPQLWNVHCTTTRLTILSRAKLLKDSASQRSLRRAMRGAPRHLLVFPQGGAPLVINEF